MSYWSQNSALSSQLDDILSKEDVSLREVMDEPEVLQECKSQNKKLIDYLSRVDVLGELIALTTNEPPNEQVEALRYKYPSIACELLTSELPQIIQTLASEQSLLDQLYAFLEADQPVNPLLASFFSRIMGILISKTGEQNWFSYQVSCLQVLEYLKSKGNCVGLLIRHIGTSAIMDLILKMYTKIEGPEIRESFLTWLDECEFLEQLVAQLNPASTSDVRSNVCQLLCDLAITHRENKVAGKTEQDPIAKKMESISFVKKLLEQMLLEPRCEGSIVGGISVLLTLLGSGKRDEFPYASWDAPPEPDSSTLTDNTVLAITPYLADFLHILDNPPPKTAVRTTVGILDPPLGATRVEVVRLLVALVATGCDELLTELQRLDLLNVLLDLFFRYPWNNFLHTQVEALLVAAFRSTKLVYHLLTQCRLLQRILEAWEDNYAQERDKKPRRGYMGHVIRISNYIVQETEKPPQDAMLSEVVDAETVSRWQEFVSTALAKVNGDQSNGMGFKQKQEEENENEFFHELHRRYYNLQAIAMPFPVNLCDEQQMGSDDDGNGNEEISVQLKSNFPSEDLDTALAKQAELFNQVCSQKMQSLDDDAEMWSSIMHKSTEAHDSRAWNDEGSSDEEPGGGHDDDADDWSGTLSGTQPVEQSNPWSSDILSASSPPDQGWANFEASPFLANFGFDLSSTIATSNPGDADQDSFDLTPTEAHQLFRSCTPDWPLNDEAPSDWPVSPPPEPRPGDVETPPTEKEEAPPPLPEIVPDDTLNPPNIDVPSPIDQVKVSIETNKPAEVKEEITVKPPQSTPSTSADEIFALQSGEMETPEVVESVNRAHVVAVSDIVRHQVQSSSSCLQADSSQSSSDAVFAAFPLETVIKQTETLTTPEVDTHNVALQLAELLAEVSVSVSPDSLSECRTLANIADAVNGPYAAGDGENVDEATPLGTADTPNNSRNESPLPMSIKDNDELQVLQDNADIVPKVSTSKITVREEEVIPNDSVTAI